jgi:hypothetical protein
MFRPLCLFRSSHVITVWLAALTLGACAASEPRNDTGAAGSSDTGTAGSTGGDGTGVGGTIGTGGTTTGTGGSGTAGTIGEAGHGGVTGTGGSVTGTGGSATGTGGSATGTGGSATGTGGRGGTTGAGGATGTGGRGGTTGTGGAIGTGGRGGTTGTGGSTAGTTGTGGSTGTGGATTVNCSAALPSGGTAHMSSNAQGTAAGLSWSIWTNSGPGTITTYSVPAFSAAWGNSGDFLARIGLQFGSSGKAVSALGTVTAQFAELNKTGDSGTTNTYSYIGIYGWSVNPCIEWYIVDDSYSKNWPFNPGGTNKGTATIDGGTYNLLLRSTTGTGGNRCGNVTSWNQFYSIRTAKRTCGQITISDHFSAWANAGMTLGNVLEASILVEVGPGGTGSIDFPVANVTSSM